VRRALLVAIIAGLLVAGVAIGYWMRGPSVVLVAPTASPGGSAPVGAPQARIGLPNPALTPGAINPNVRAENITDTICKSGWTKTVRPPSAYTGALKLAQIVEYGYADKNRSHYQEDHLVPLELGGAPRDPRNLWPQPLTATLRDGTSVGADEKDDLEDELRRRVCDGTLGLVDAQRSIAGDWVQAWIDAGRP
jgi:hypothetical protein